MLYVTTVSRVAIAFTYYITESKPVKQRAFLSSSNSDIAGVVCISLFLLLTVAKLDKRGPFIKIISLEIQHLIAILFRCGVLLAGLTKNDGESPPHRQSCVKAALAPR